VKWFMNIIANGLFFEQKQQMRKVASYADL